MPRSAESVSGGGLWAVPALVLVAGAATAGSDLRFRAPALGELKAAVWNDEGRSVGRSTLRVEKWGAGDGRRVEVRTRVDSGRGVDLDARLEPVGQGRLMRAVWQRARSLAPNGEVEVSAEIDHRTRRAICTFEGKRSELELPNDDRLGNVVANLLLEPLADGRMDDVRFQFLLCRGKPRTLEAVARRVAALSHIGPYRGVAQIEYKFDLGGILGALASPFLPSIHFWIAPGEESAWLGHRMPLFPRGRPRLVLRDGLKPGDLSADKD